PGTDETIAPTLSPAAGGTTRGLRRDPTRGHRRKPADYHPHPRRCLLPASRDRALGRHPASHRSRGRACPTRTPIRRRRIATPAAPPHAAPTVLHERTLGGSANTGMVMGQVVISSECGG